MSKRIYRTHLKSLLKLSIPIITGQIGWVLMAFFDNLMVGQVGYVELAAAGITNSVFFLVSIFGFGVLMVIPTIVAAKSIGPEKYTLKNLHIESYWLSQILSLFTILILLGVYFNFDILEQKPEVEAIAKPYYLLIAFSVFPNMWFMAAKNICDGYGKTAAPMLITLLAVLVNIALNWVFIFGNGVQPMGLTGAGVATLISRLFMALCIAFYMRNNSQLPGSTQKLVGPLPLGKWLYIREILSMGIPSGLQYFFEVAAFAFAAIMAGWLGARQLAAHQIGITLSSLTYMFALGISTSASIIIGNAFAKNNIEKSEKAGLTALGLIATIMTVFGLVFLFLRFPLSHMFSEDAIVVSMTASLLLIAAAYQIFDGVQGVALGVLRGLRDVKIPLIFTLFSYWILSIPMAYVLAFKLNWGLKGLWIGLTAGLISSSVLLSMRFRYLLKKI